MSILSPEKPNYSISDIYRMTDNGLEIFKREIHDFSLNKNKPLFIKFTYYSKKPIYYYDTLLDYILNRKKYKSETTLSSNRQDHISGWK